MNALDVVAHSYQQMRSAILADPTMLLMATGYWLDPLRLDAPTTEDGGWVVLQDEDMSGNEQIIHAVRGTCVDNGWIDIYAEANWIFWNGYPVTDVSFDVHFCARIGRQLPGEIPDLEHLWYGQFYPPFWGRSPYQDQEQPPWHYLVDIFDHHHNLRGASSLLESLGANEATFFNWVFGLTGNTLFDLSDEEYFEGGGELPYIKDAEIMFEVASEAEDLWKSAQSGIDWFEQEDAFDVMCHLALITYYQNIEEKCYVRNNTKTTHDRHEAQRWIKRALEGNRQGADDEPELLPVWDCVAA